MAEYITLSLNNLKPDLEGNVTVPRDSVIISKERYEELLAIEKGQEKFQNQIKNLQYLNEESFDLETKLEEKIKLWNDIRRLHKDKAVCMEDKIKLKNDIRKLNKEKATLMEGIERLRKSNNDIKGAYNHLPDTIKKEQETSSEIVEEESP